MEPQSKNMWSMMEPQYLMQAIVRWWNNQVWKYVHKGWSTKTGNVSGIIDQDRNWPIGLAEVEACPIGGWSYYYCFDVVPALVEIMDFLWPSIWPLPQMTVGTVVQPMSSVRVSCGKHVHQDWWFDVKPNAHLFFWKQILLLPRKLIQVGRSPSVSRRAWEAISPSVQDIH